MLKRMGKTPKENGLDDSRPDPVWETPPKPEGEPATTGSRKTVIGEKIAIEGTIRGQEDLVIDGMMKGTIELEKNQVLVGPKGKVEAEIRVADINISGRLIGNIQASGKVSFTKQADFIGEIKAKRISVEDGAYLKAAIELERESGKPAPVAAAAKEPAAKTSPAKASGQAVKKG